MDKELINKIANIFPSPVHQHICIGELHAKEIITLVTQANKAVVKEALKNIYIEDNYSDHIKHGFEMARGEALRAADNVFNTTLQ